MKSIIFLAFLAAAFNISFAGTYYVNNVTGNDTLPDYGTLSSKPFKTIKQAVKAAEQGDIISIEGKNDGKQLIYHESVVIEFSKENLVITGVNSPILDGMDEENDKPFLYGLFIKSKGTAVTGLKFQNFISRDVNEYGFHGGAAILCYDVLQPVLKDIEITNCNWGILLYETEAASVQNVKISDLKRSKEVQGIVGGGVGIMALSLKNSLQRTSIGNEQGNTITNAETCGIYFGNDSADALADFALIQNNVITGSQKGPAIALVNLNGNAKITKNIFENNNHAIFIKGVNIDLWISENTFKGSTGPYEIKSTEKYPASIIYDIWKSNDNVFEKPTFAVTLKKKRITAWKGMRYIWNNEEEARKTLEGKLQLETYK